MGEVNWRVPAEHTGLLRKEALYLLSSKADAVEMAALAIVNGKPHGDVAELAMDRAELDAVGRLVDQLAGAGPIDVMAAPGLLLGLVDGAITDLGEHLHAQAEAIGSASRAADLRETMRAIEWLLSEREDLAPVRAVR